MSEALIVTWQKDSLNLYRLPSEGTWTEGVNPIRSVDIHRPSRTTRFDHPESGGRLVEALGELFLNLEINLPVWFLIPDNWALSCKLPIIDLPSEEHLHTHFFWEIRQRIHGDASDYLVLIPPEPVNAEYELFVVKKELVDTIAKDAIKAGLELAGLGIEPRLKEQYTFELPRDLRDAIPLETEIPEPVTMKKTVSPAVGIIVVIAVLAIPVVYYLSTSSSKSPKQKTEITKQEKSPSSEARVEKTKSEPKTETTPAKPGTTPSKTTQPTVTAQQVVSLFGQFVKSLPGGANIQLAVLSPVDFRIEVTGVNNPDAWINKLKTQPKFKGARIVGNYYLKKRPVVVVQVENAGLTPGSGIKDVKRWEKRAVEFGLKSKHRRAWGGYDQAVKFVDALWGDLSGFGKIYFAPEKNYWVVTVQ